MGQTSSIQLPSEYPGKPWQPLFDHLAETQDKILTLDEMEELVNVVAKMIGHRELLEKAERYEKALKAIQAKAKQGIFPHLPVETMGAQMCIEIDGDITELFTPKTSSDD